MPDETSVTPHFISLGEAAKRSKQSKATISRAIASGKLAVREKGEDGAYRIDPAELVRYMSTVSPVRRATGDAETQETTATPSKDKETTPETAYETRLAILKERSRAELAEQRLADLKAQLDAMKEAEGRARADHRAQLDDVRADRDQWREQAQRLALPAPDASPKPERRGFFGLFRRAG